MHTVLLSQRAERAVDGPDRPDWISGQVVNRGIELNGAGPLHKDGIWT